MTLLYIIRCIELCVLYFACGRSSELCINKTILNLGLMGYTDVHSPPAWFSKLGSAMYLALERLNSDENILPCFPLNISIAYTKCNRKVALDEFVKLVLFSKIDAIIGPSCATVTENVGLLASQWNIPLVRFGSSTDILRNPIYDTVVSTKGTFEYLGQIIHGIAKELKFNTICMSIPLPRAHWIFVENGMMFYNKNSNITLHSFEFDYYKRAEYSTHQESLRRIRNSCRGRMTIVSIGKVGLRSDMLVHVSGSNWVPKIGTKEGPS